MNSPRIEIHTPIVPRAVAEAVLEEATLYLGQKLPRSWIGVLVRRSNTIFTRNPTFRRQIRSAGNLGRDRLWAFHRHWLAALIQKHHPDLYARFPASYTIGAPLHRFPSCPS